MRGQLRRVQLYKEKLLVFLKLEPPKITHPKRRAVLMSTREPHLSKPSNRLRCSLSYASRANPRQGSDRVRSMVDQRQKRVTSRHGGSILLFALRRGS